MFPGYPVLSVPILRGTMNIDLEFWLTVKSRLRNRWAIDSHTQYSLTDCVGVVIFGVKNLLWLVETKKRKDERGSVTVKWSSVVAFLETAPLIELLCWVLLVRRGLRLLQSITENAKKKNNKISLWSLGMCWSYPITSILSKPFWDKFQLTRYLNMN